MVGVNTKLNVADAAFFIKSHVNAVVISTLEILKTHLKKEQNNTSKMWPKSSWMIIIQNILLLTSLKILHKTHPTTMGAIHGNGLMTEEYTPNNWRSRTAQNIIKILIIFLSSVTLIAICDTWWPILPPPWTIIPSRCAEIFPIFYYPTLCGWYEGNYLWQPVNFTLGHRLSEAIFHPVGVMPDITKLNLTMPECTNHLFYKMKYKWIPPPSSSPPTPNKTFRSHPLHRHT